MWTDLLSGHWTYVVATSYSTESWIKVGKSTLKREAKFRVQQSEDAVKKKSSVFYKFLFWNPLVKLGWPSNKMDFNFTATSFQNLYWSSFFSGIRSFMELPRIKPSFEFFTLPILDGVNGVFSGSFFAVDFWTSVDQLWMDSLFERSLFQTSSQKIFWFGKMSLEVFWTGVPFVHLYSIRLESFQRSSGLFCLVDESLTIGENFYRIRQLIFE